MLGDEARSCGGFQYYFSGISNMLATANSAVNFLIYIAFNQRFRTILTHLMRGEGYPPAKRRGGVGGWPPVGHASAAASGGVKGGIGAKAFEEGKGMEVGGSGMTSEGGTVKGNRVNIMTVITTTV